MRKLLFITLLTAAVTMHADLLDDMIGREAYEPRRLSTEQQDSILNGAPEVKYSIRLHEPQSIWRHSREGKCYIREVARDREWLMTDTLIRDAVLSPNSRYIAYGRGNNLWLYKVDYKTEIPITDSPMPIYNGVTDWLYEEEFGVTNLIAFSPDNKYIAFVRLDDREVPNGPFGPYPKAGDSNPKASVHIYDIFYKSVREVTIDTAGETDYYIPRIVWESSEGSEGSEGSEATLRVTWINRNQNERRIYEVNPKSMVCHPVDTYRNPTGWVDVEDEKLKGGDKVEKLKVEKLKDVWEETVSRRYSADGKRYIECRESVNCPPVYTLYKSGKSGKPGTAIRVIEDNAELKARWDELQMPEKEPFHFVTERGDTLYGWMLIPNEQGAVRDSNGRIVGHDRMLRRFPVVMTQYSGPESRRVVNRWSKRYEYYLAKKGYIVVCVDPRGTDGRGRKWKEATYMNLGQKEAEDQIATAHYIAGLPYVDSSRISMIGWSYGGYTVLRTLEEQGIRQQTRNEAALIRRGVAIAPVTDWRLYDSAYTERYMRRPQVNEDGYEAASVLNKTQYLTGELLLIHGLGDDNVHPEHSLQLIQSLVDNGRHFELMLYPDDNHFLRKGRNLRDVHERLERFIAE